MKHYFCTYFDRNYLLRGIALYHSMRKHCAPFHFWMLCMDVESFETLSKMDLPHVTLISLVDFEMGDADLLKAKSNRMIFEYYFTCTPSLCLYILDNFQEVNMITYVDSDLYFFSNADSVYDEIGDHSIAIIEHRFTPKLHSKVCYGIYNVGLLSFRRDENGVNALRWWRDKCNEWCYDRVEEGRFADQKYLDDWPIRFKNLIILKHKGANLAPWNIENYKILFQKDRIFVDDQPLVFYHFHGFKRLTAKVYDTGLTHYGSKISDVTRTHIYEPYLNAVLDAQKELAHDLKATFSFQHIRMRQGVSLLRQAYRRINKILYLMYQLVIRKDYVKVPKLQKRRQ